MSEEVMSREEWELTRENRKYLNIGRKQGALEELRMVENALFPWSYAKKRIKRLERKSVEK